MVIDRLPDARCWRLDIGYSILDAGGVAEGIEHSAEGKAYRAKDGSWVVNGCKTF